MSFNTSEINGTVADYINQTAQVPAYTTQTLYTYMGMTSGLKLSSTFTPVYAKKGSLIRAQGQGPSSRLVIDTSFTNNYADYAYTGGYIASNNKWRIFLRVITTEAATNNKTFQLAKRYSSTGTFPLTAQLQTKYSLLQAQQIISVFDGKLNLFSIY